MSERIARKAVEDTVWILVADPTIVRRRGNVSSDN